MIGYILDNFVIPVLFIIVGLTFVDLADKMMGVEFAGPDIGQVLHVFLLMILGKIVFSYPPKSED